MSPSGGKPGRVEVEHRYPADCTNTAMMRPEPLAVIGPVVAAELARVDQAGGDGHAAS